MIKCILFDFDGVIVESVDVKTEAFKILFKDYPQHIEAITQFHINNGGMSRYDKFRFIYKHILKEELSVDKFNQLCERFSELVVEKVILAPFVEGAQELLDKCLGHYKMFVISGTPEREIKEIVRRRDLEKYFAGVFGSPATKTDLIKGILRNNDYHPREVIFVGDSVNDFQAAKDTGLFFVARVLDKNTTWLHSSEVKVRFDNFVNVAEFLEKLEVCK